MFNTVGQFKRREGCQERLSVGQATEIDCHSFTVQPARWLQRRLTFAKVKAQPSVNIAELVTQSIWRYRDFQAHRI